MNFTQQELENMARQGMKPQGENTCSPPPNEMPQQPSRMKVSYVLRERAKRFRERAQRDLTFADQLEVLADEFLSLPYRSEEALYQLIDRSTYPGHCD